MRRFFLSLFKKSYVIYWGKVTKINAVVSYMEAEDPYKNPNKIYKIKNKNTEEVIAIEVNDKIYKAMYKKSF